MKIRPLADRVVIKPVDQEEKRQGGIIIPDTAKEKPQQGLVVAVGPGKDSDAGKKIPMEVMILIPLRSQYRGSLQKRS